MTKAKASSMLLFLQYYKEMKSMLIIPISPLHFGLDPTEAYQKMKTEATASMAFRRKLL